MTAAKETRSVSRREDEEVSFFRSLSHVENCPRCVVDWFASPLPCGLVDVCMCVCVFLFHRMATKLLRLAADEKREAKRDGQPPSGM